jgi:hypothetical protein
MQKPGATDRLVAWFQINLLCQPRIIDKYGEIALWKLAGESQSTLKESYPLSFFPLLIPTLTSPELTRPSAVRCRRLKATCKV